MSDLTMLVAVYGGSIWLAMGLIEIAISVYTS